MADNVEQDNYKTTCHLFLILPFYVNFMYFFSLTSSIIFIIKTWWSCVGSTIFSLSRCQTLLKDVDLIPIDCLAATKNHVQFFEKLYKKANCVIIINVFQNGDKVQDVWQRLLVYISHIALGFSTLITSFWDLVLLPLYQ